MHLSDRVLLALNMNPGQRAKTLATKLRVRRKVVNQLLYGELASSVTRDKEAYWWPVSTGDLDSEQADANRLLLRSLAPSLRSFPGVVSDERPIELSLGKPIYLQMRFYLFPLRDPSPRSNRAYINLTIGEADGLNSFDRSEGYRPIVAGYLLDDEIFVLFDADVYEMDGGFRYNRFCYVDEALPLRAMVSGPVTETRSLRKPRIEEVVVACRASDLITALQQRFQLTVQRILDG